MNKTLEKIIEKVEKSNELKIDNDTTFDMVFHISYTKSVRIITIIGAKLKSISFSYLGSDKLLTFEFEDKFGVTYYLDYSFRYERNTILMISAQISKNEELNETLDEDSLPINVLHKILKLIN